MSNNEARRISAHLPDRITPCFLSLLCVLYVLEKSDASSYHLLTDFD